MRNQLGDTVKLGVFVGSVSSGLDEARKEVFKAIRRTGHIAEGMEDWTAGSRPTLDEIDRPYVRHDGPGLIRQL
jgi:hypothetical protein